MIYSTVWEHLMETDLLHTSETEYLIDPLGEIVFLTFHQL